MPGHRSGLQIWSKGAARPRSLRGSHPAPRRLAPLAPAWTHLHHRSRRLTLAGLRATTSPGFTKPGCRYWRSGQPLGGGDCVRRGYATDPRSGQSGASL